jgi:hypothetical protein
LQDYFREISRQDISNLLSFVVEPDDDDALLVPQLGRTVREPLPASARPHPPPPAAAQGQPAAGAAAHDEEDGGEVGASLLILRGLCGAGPLFARNVCAFTHQVRVGG